MESFLLQLLIIQLELFLFHQMTNVGFVAIHYITIYTEEYGTVVGTHYHKYCQKFRKGCNFRQYYGYSSEGNQSLIFYDTQWAEQKYFVSSSETAFEVDMLRKFDSEILIGQISYNQKAEIYNYFNVYPVQPKKCSKQEKENKDL